MYGGLRTSVTIDCFEFYSELFTVIVMTQKWLKDFWDHLSGEHYFS